MNGRIYLDTSAYDLSGRDIGWGFNASTVINAGKRLKFKLQGEYGEGFENYMADPSPDVALESNPGNSLSPVKGKALPAWGFLSFVEVEWTTETEKLDRLFNDKHYKCGPAIA